MRAPKNPAPATGRTLRPARHPQFPQPEHRGRERQQDDHDQADHPRALQGAAEDRTAKGGENTEHRVRDGNSHHIREGKRKGAAFAVLGLLGEKANGDRDQWKDARRQVQGKPGQEHADQEQRQRLRSEIRGSLENRPTRWIARRAPGRALCLQILTSFRTPQPSRQRQSEPLPAAGTVCCCRPAQ